MRQARFVLPLGAALLLAPPAIAHHPGSHATRLSDGRVKLEVATVGDGCTGMGTIAAGVPRGTTAPPGAVPVIATVKRPAEAICIMIAKPVTGEAVLALPASAAAIHLFIVDPDGTVRSTERVPIR